MAMICAKCGYPVMPNGCPCSLGLPFGLHLREPWSNRHPGVWVLLLVAGTVVTAYGLFAVMCFLGR